MTTIPLSPTRTGIRPGLFLHVAGVVLLGAAAVTAFSMASSRRHAEARELKARAAAVQAGVKVMVAKTRSALPTRSLVLQGDVRGFRQATVYAKVSGYLKTLRVDRGDLVQANDILGIIESPETAQQEFSARAELLLRKQTERRVRNLVPSGVVSQQDLDNASGGLAVARAEADRIRALRGYEVLRAPFAGRVTARYVDPGSLLSAATGATQSAQPVLDLADTGRVRIFIYPGQLDAARVHEGDKVTFWTDAEPARRRADHIQRTAYALDPRTRTMLAEIDVDNRDQSLHPGSSVHVELTVPSPGGVTVPAEALVLHGGKAQAAVVRAARIHFTPIEVADDDGKVVRVSSGLALGDEVVLHPSDDIVEGGQVIAIAGKEEK